jgi:hypothetical protein
MGNPKTPETFTGRINKEVFRSSSENVKPYNKNDQSYLCMICESNETITLASISVASEE